MKKQKISAGLLMYKFDKEKKLRVFLVHPGGPFWKDKDSGAWSIPKGEVDDNDGKDLLETAKREFREETGIVSPKENEKYFYLGEIEQKNKKIVHAWAFEGDWSGLLMCQSFVEIEWPYKSGKIIKISEVDKADFFTAEKAKEKINPAQFAFIEKLGQFYLKIISK